MQKSLMAMIVPHSYDYTPARSPCSATRKTGWYASGASMKALPLPSPKRSTAAPESEEVNRRAIRNHGLGWLAIFGGFLGLMGLLAILIALAAAPWWGLAPTVLAVAFLATAAAWCGYRFGADSRRPSGPISQRH